jgi:hypothetical protein
MMKYKVGDKVQLVSKGFFAWMGDFRDCYGIVVGLGPKNNPWIGLDLYLKKDNSPCCYLNTDRGGKAADGKGWAFYDKNLTPYMKVTA